jgi:hypothetical protein
MKKNIVLLSFYPSHCCLSFFASGVNGFTTPVITLLYLIWKWESLNGETVTLNGKITILGFSGSDILKIEEIF